MSDRYAEVEIESYPLSASQVKTHSKCPYQYFLRYVQGREATQKPSKYIRLGNRVHETLEELLKAGELPLDDQQMLRSILVEDYISRNGYWLPDKEYKRGQKCMKKAANYLHKRQPDIRDIERRAQFEIDRDNIQTEVNAMMDVTTQDEIWDWKTGRIRDDTEHEEKIQGTVYMAAFFHLYDAPPSAIRFVYLSEGKVRTVDPTDENWEYMLKFARKLLKAKRDSVFPANVGSHCYWCSYEMWCDKAPTGVGNVSWEEY